mmetsp:Transcript_10288/g.26120  ORF Transcript_10288/g.26120 Transcript_10288/m.26120 type:complete len:217 (+) Transcript_10288:85-735(+)
MLASVVGLMAKEGPVVKAVRMGEDGTVAEHTMDMTPRKDEITKVLRGKATFIGQYQDQGVVLLCVRDREEGVHGLNGGKLAAPFHALDEEVFGDVLMIKMSDDAEPLDFTLDEYHVLCTDQAEKLARGVFDKKDDEEAPEEAGEDEGMEMDDDEEEDGEEEDEEEDEDEDEDEDGDEDEDVDGGDEDEDADEDDNDEDGEEEAEVKESVEVEEIAK